VTGVLRRWGVGGGIVVALAASAPAQDPAPGPDRPAHPAPAVVEEDALIFPAGRWEYRKAEAPGEPDRLVRPDPFQITRAKGGPPILEADRAVVWVRQGRASGGLGGAAALLSLRESGLVIYAEGNVVFRPGPGRVIRSEALLYDAPNDRVVAGASRLQVPLPDGTTPLVATAERIWLDYAPGGKDRLDAYDVHVGTCEFGHPHYSLTAVQLRLTGAIGRRAVKDTAEGEWLQLRGVGAEVWGVPVLWLPGMDWNLDWDSPIRAFEAGTGRATGPFARGLFGITLRQSMPQEEGPPKRIRAGEIGLRLEGFTERGWGAGGEARWTGRRTRAPRDAFGDRPLGLEFDVIGIGWNDRGDPRDDDAPPGLWPVEDRERGRTAARAAWHGAEQWRVGGEWHWLSDRNVLREFAEKVLKEDKAPESYAESLIWEGPMAAQLLARARVNDFQDQTEYLPRWRLLGASVPLPGPFAASWDGQFANVRRSFDERSGKRPYRAGRGDARVGFEWRLLEPLWDAWFDGARVPLTVTAATWARYTFWTEGPATRDTVDRWAQGAAIVARTDLWRVYGAGADRFRHVVSPELRYDNTFGVTREAADLLWFDEVEELAVGEVLRGVLRNRIQVRHGGGHRDWLFAEVTGGWYPRPNRDHAGERWADATGEIRWAPTAAWVVWARAEWSFVTDAVSEWDAGLKVPGILPGLSVSLASHNVTDVVHTMTGAAAYKFSNRWAASASFSYDFERGEAERTRFVLRRTLHRWMIEGGVSVDHRDRDFTVLIAVGPTGLGRGNPFSASQGEGDFDMQAR
jgi:hypothetical protein